MIDVEKWIVEGKRCAVKILMVLMTRKKMYSMIDESAVERTH